MLVTVLKTGKITQLMLQRAVEPSIAHEPNLA